MKKIAKLLCLVQIMFLFAAVLPLSARAEEEPSFTLSRAFGDNMILQREASVPVWGWSEKTGSTVTVTFHEASVQAVVDESGCWQAALPAMSASTQGAPLTVSTDADGYTVTLENVLVGDVYVLSGQSNAELSLERILQAYPDLRQELDKNSSVRLFAQSRYYAAAHPDTMESPAQDVINPAWKWRGEDSTAMQFPAIGYFFAKEVSAAAGIPVGVIQATSSGSPLAHFVPADTAAENNISSSNDIPTGGMYNALLAPFQKMRIKGFLFYQGENDQGNAARYADMLSVYVSELRKRFGWDFPFYNVQLSSHGGDGLTSWPKINQMRLAQYTAYKNIENSFLIVSMDEGYRDGDPDFAHPFYKKPVGHRLALAALTHDYGIGTLESSLSPDPVYAYLDDRGVIIKFRNVGDGLQTMGSHDKLLGFRVLLDGGIVLRNLQATILSKDTVLLENVKEAIGIGYGLELVAMPEGDDEQYIANLCNSAGLPAPAFQLTEVLKGEPTEAPVLTPTPLPETGGPTQTPAPDGDKKLMPFLPEAIIAAILLGGGAVLLLYKKKKKQ